MELSCFVYCDSAEKSPREVNSIVKETKLIDYSIPSLNEHLKENCSQLIVEQLSKSILSMNGIIP
jgi:hypothetical protein